MQEQPSCRMLHHVKKTVIPWITVFCILSEAFENFKILHTHGRIISTIHSVSTNFAALMLFGITRQPGNHTAEGKQTETGKLRQQNQKFVSFVPDHTICFFFPNKDNLPGGPIANPPGKPCFSERKELSAIHKRSIVKNRFESRSAGKEDYFIRGTLPVMAAMATKIMKIPKAHFADEESL